MTLIIDGHNLIPHVPGMQLADMDDETQLIQYVQEYCRRRRVKAELFFDGAPAGSKPVSGGGMVHVHFVRKGQTADDAITAYAARQGKAARNCTVVSSDHRVQTEVRALGCAVLTSEQFAAEMMNSLSQIEIYSKDDAGPLQPDEVDKWLKVFSERGKKV